MNTEIMSETLAQSLAGKITFPDVVRILTAEDVESYRADLVRLEETFYSTSGETFVEKMDLPRGDIALNFSAAEVASAIRASQAGTCDYREFLSRLMSAGTTSYEVFLSGKQCIYFGRKGEFHVEEFPRQAVT